MSTKVSLIIGEHVVDVPKIMNLPVQTAMKLFNEEDPNKQFVMMLDALCEEVKPKVTKVLLAMDAESAMAVVTDWIKKSLPGNEEEPEVV